MISRNHFDFLSDFEELDAICLMTPFELSSLGDLGRFTVIAVDAGVRAVDGASAFDVLFIGTTSGRVLKLYHLKVHSRRIENT